MKKLGVAVAVVVLLCGFTNLRRAQAAETEPATERTLTVRELSEQERANYADVIGSMEQIEISDIISVPEVETNASYTPYRYSTSFGFYDGDLLVATADESCIVWRYTDGKVHLYQRTISVEYLYGYSASRSYGSIVNTDGSISYTSGDTVLVYNDAATWRFALEFYATPDDQWFSCYPV